MPETDAIIDTPLTGKTHKLIEAVRQPFQGFAAGFLGVKRTALAPKFMHAYKAWHAETKHPFASFVRLYDPTIPEDSDGYRAHPVYAAADNLRRLAPLTHRHRKPSGPAPVSPIRTVAYLLATFTPLVKDMDIIWAAFTRELHWTEKRVQAVQELVQSAGPLRLARGPRKLKLAA